MDAFYNATLTGCCDKLKNAEEEKRKRKSRKAC